MLNFDLADQYWPEMTATARPLHAGNEIRDPAAVVEILRSCFRYLEEKFMALIAAETRASFYLAVHRFHESTTELWLQQLRGYNPARKQLRLRCRAAGVEADSGTRLR